MEPRKARQRRKRFVDLGIILHRARTQRIEAVVHAVDAVRQRGIVPDKLIFAHLRQAQRLFARRRQRHDGHVARGKQRQAMAGRAPVQRSSSLAAHLLQKPDHMVERFLICQLRHAPENSALHRQAAQNPVRVQHFQRLLGARAGGHEFVEEFARDRRASSRALLRAAAQNNARGTCRASRPAAVRASPMAAR